MTRRERDALVDAFYEQPYSKVKRWVFQYIPPVGFVYRHPSGKNVFFTPDYEEPGTLVIQVSDPGEALKGFQAEFTSMRADDLFALVRPFLKVGAGRKGWDPRGQR